MSELDAFIRRAAFGKALHAELGQQFCANRAHHRIPLQPRSGM